jgi:hypothetical protein
MPPKEPEMAKFGFQIRSPVAYMEFPAEWREEDLRSFYDQFGDAIRKGKIRGEVWDLSKVNPLFSTARQRKLVSECVKEIAPLLPGVMIAAGRVVPNSLVRGVVTAVDWLTGQYEHPVQNFALQFEAEQFVVDKLLAAHIDVPEHARVHTSTWPEARVASGRRN